jgi:ribosomal protein L40E
MIEPSLKELAEKKLYGRVCRNCYHNNPKNRNVCRKCKCSDLRDKHKIKK